MTLKGAFLFSAFLLITALPCAAQQQDRPGSKDPALLTRMPNFYIEEYKDVQFDAHEFVVANGNSTANQHVEGHLTYWRYDSSRRPQRFRAGSRSSATTRTPCRSWAARRCPTPGPATITIRRF